MRFVSILCLSILLAGCMSNTSAPPVVADFNGDSVKVNVDCAGGNACLKPRPEDDAEANRICQTRGRKAQYASSTQGTKIEPILGITQYNFTHLYLCV